MRVGTKWGYINTKGAVAITPQFNGAGGFRYGRAIVILGDRYGFIDRDGKYISSPTFRWAVPFSGDWTPVQTSDGTFALVDRSGKVVVLDKVQQLGYSLTARIIPAASGGKWGFIDTTGKWVIDPQFEEVKYFADGLAPVRVGGRWGYIDQKGKFIVNPQYDRGFEFSEGLAWFENGGKFGFVDSKGRVVVDAKFLAASGFSEGLAPVKTDDGWGYIDPTGKMVVSPQFDMASSFQNGLALVTVLGKVAYITTTGAFVVDPFPGPERARMAAQVAAKVNASVDCESEACGVAVLEAAKANAANRSRLEGEWVGTTGRLTIAIDGSIVGAVYFPLTGGRVTEWEGPGLDGSKLYFSGAKDFGASGAKLRLELSADGGSLNGDIRDAAGNTVAVAMTKSRP